MYTKNDIYELHIGISNAKAKLKDKIDGKLSYALSLNLRRIKDIVQSIDDVRKEMLDEYNKEMEKIAEKHAEKNENGSPKMVSGGGYAIQKNLAKYYKEKEALDLKYKDAIDKFAAIMKEDAGEVNIFKVKSFPDMPFEISDPLFLMREEPESADNKEIPEPKKES